MKKKISKNKKKSSKNTTTMGLKIYQDCVKVKQYEFIQRKENNGKGGR